jgi:tetratricopeptide (TPR) repeat protein
MPAICVTIRTMATTVDGATAGSEGMALLQAGKLHEADLAEAGNPELLNNLGKLYKDQGRLTDAVVCYERALKLNPMLPQAFSNMLSATKLDSTLSPADILRKHRAWSGWFEAVSATAPLLTHLADPDRVLRIGYVSPDCRTAAGIHRPGHRGPRSQAVRGVLLFQQSAATGKAARTRRGRDSSRAAWPR